jgi:tetratricopeptide (TPR) repeat protein
MRIRFCLSAMLTLFALLLPTPACSQVRTPNVPTSPSDNLTSTFVAPDVEISVKCSDGKPADDKTLVQLITLGGQLYAQISVKNGVARFQHVPKSEYKILVVAPGYQRSEGRIVLSSNTILGKAEVILSPLSDAEDAASSRSIATLNPKAQKELGKALEALRTNKPNNALPHLEAAQKNAPNSADVEYLLGVYESRVNESAQAQIHWNKALSINPEHLSALLELGQQLLNEKKASEALLYLNHAVAAEPSAWRAHALLAEADYMHGDLEPALEHAQRALDLGHDRASSLLPFVANILAQRGEKDRALQILQAYVKSNPSDASAVNQLAQLNNASTVVPSSPSDKQLNAVSIATTALPIPSNWLPPDVDEKIPQVEFNAACSLDEVVSKAGDQLVTLVHDVDRFTATESVVDETINKWGVSSSPEKRKFGYVVSIQEIRSGVLSVDEYRDNGVKPVDFPDGVITNGLPALVMIFHPFYAGNYEMNCEGLATLNGRLAWQVHFRQLPDKPIANRGFRMGSRGSSYPAALRGRAWISSDTYQIVRLETDLVRPVPEIRLVAEHAAVEYGVVTFREQNLDLWLPHSAEVYFDWHGQRVHRRHSFDNYMLFSVDEQQRIGTPKGAKPPATAENNINTKPSSQED